MAINSATVRLDRRRLLGAAGSVAALLAAPVSCTWVSGRQDYVASSDPFTLGIASGEPFPDSVVLWTRLAPDPLVGGGMPAQRVPVEWELGADESFRRVVRRGTATADPSFAHSVHVEVDGLEPASWYFYRFRSGGAISPVGRTRTAPAGVADRLRLAVASCQHYEQGFYTAYQHMAGEDLDLVLHLGDYIYESDTPPDRPRPRQHNSTEPVTLDEYRNRYALYRAMRTCRRPMRRSRGSRPGTTMTSRAITPISSRRYRKDTEGPAPDPRAGFPARRAAAYQAYYEHLPLRRAQRPKGADMQLYRHLAFAGLVDLQVLDTRQYRTDQPCGDERRAPRCAGAFDPAATMTGPVQEQWLLDGLSSSRARWKVVAQQLPILQRDWAAGPQRAFDMDRWDGYPAARNRFLWFVAAREIPNLVVLSGDIHAFFASDLKADYDDASSPTVGAEFVATSISSTGDGFDTTPDDDALVAESPHIRFHNRRRGYLRCEVTPELWRTDMRAVDVVTTPDAPVTTKASFVVENGRAAITPA